MTISPDTLSEEPDDVRRHREKLTGVFGNGMTVLCRPAPIEEPEVAEVRSRVVCLVRPYKGCSMCTHADFTLVFRNDRREEKQVQVACPRWANRLDMFDNKSPDSYEMVEMRTCDERPFPFCTSCPSRENVEKYGADKTKEGWFGRWHRLRKMEFEDD